MTFGERLQIQELDFSHDGIFKLMPRSDRCISVLEDYVEK
jgi:hypothetical protein